MNTKEHCDERLIPQEIIVSFPCEVRHLNEVSPCPPIYVN